MKKKKLLIILAVVVVVVIFVLANLMKSGEKVYKVEAEKIKKGEISSVVSASGRVLPKRTVKISAYVPAKIFQLPVEDGDWVKQGQLLVQLDPTSYQAAMDQYKAQTKVAQANLEQAQMVFDRQKELFERNLTSKEQYDASLTSLNVSKAQFEQSKAALEKARDDFSKTQITSPMTGVVTELNAEVGEIVMIGTMNNPGTVIMTISDLSEIEVEVEVDETDIANVKLGQDTKIEIDAFPDTSYKGEVTEIGNTAKISGYGTQEQVTNFMVKVLLLEEVSGIKPGMSASVDITTDKRLEVLKAPIACVVMRKFDSDSLKKEEEEVKGSEAKASEGEEEEEKTEEKEEKKDIEGIFVIENEKAKFVPVETGISDEQNIEIMSGLREKDEIIIGPYKTLRTIKDGNKVKVTKKSKDKKAKD
ncbi:MAG: efflux RND transporter periplasmic adaptor subunit [Candidatus Zixiibacteriota bacterium]